MHLPEPVEALGLEEIDCSASSGVIRGGSPQVEIALQTLSAMEPLIRTRGSLTEEELALLYRLYRDPGFGFVDTLQFAVWGRKPAA